MPYVKHICQCADAPTCDVCGRRRDKMDQLGCQLLADQQTRDIIRAVFYCKDCDVCVLNATDEAMADCWSPDFPFRMRQLADGRWKSLVPLTFGRARITIGDGLTSVSHGW